MVAWLMQLICHFLHHRSCGGHHADFIQILYLYNCRNLWGAICCKLKQPELGGGTSETMIHCFSNLVRVEEPKSRKISFN